MKKTPQKPPRTEGPKKPRIGEQFEVAVTAMDADGYGLGTYQETPVLINGALPGELVRARVAYPGKREIFADTVKVLKGIHPRYTLEAAERLRDFDRPTMLAWATEDRFFKLSFAERLADTIPGATLERIEDSYTFVSEDQPERLASLIEAFSSRAAIASG